MWFFGMQGFFSVVHDKFCGPDELMVRARVKDHLKRLIARLPEDEYEIIELADADYQWRLKVKREVWAKYVYDQAKDLNYANVKGSINQYRPNSYMHARYEKVLQDIWSALQNFQEDLKIRAWDEKD